LDGSCRAFEKDEQCIHVRSDSVKRGDRLEYVAVDWRIMSKLILTNRDKSVWTGFIWLRIETCGELL
jgi:hypothetical protein